MKSQNHLKEERMHSRILVRLFFISMMLGLPSFATMAQVYTSSGSTGSDGALAFPNAHPGDTIIFNPASYTPKLNPSGNGVFNFTTITIPAGVTVKLSALYIHSPVYWLATGSVDIEGTLDLSGSNGSPQSILTALRTPAIPGAGGYPGGVGGNHTTGSPSEPGLGPLGGYNGSLNSCAGDGGLGANSLLVPLFGGSGGGGVVADNTFGAGGGAGGGAILIASSTLITVNGAIYANGGSGGPGGGGGSGAGGTIRLIATEIAGSGSMSVAGGGGCTGATTAGIIRQEANQFAFTGAENGNVTSGTPFATFVPTTSNPAPTVKVLSVGNVAVNQSPTGNFATPDVTVNSSAALPIVVGGTNVPVGTIVHLQIYSENGPDILVDTPALAGTLQSSTATVSVTFPSGFSRGYVTASF